MDQNQKDLGSVFESNSEAWIANSNESQLRFAKEILSCTNSLILVADNNGCIVFVSPSVRQFLGFEPEELLGDQWWDKACPNGALERRKLILLKATGKEPISSSYQNSLKRKDGTDCWVLWQDSKGPNNTLIGIAQDITAHKLAEDRLRRSEERFQLASKASDDYLWDWDLVTGQLVIAGKENFFGHNAADFSPEAWLEAIHHKDRERVNNKLRAAIAGREEVWSDEYQFLRADGSYAHVFDRGCIVRDEAGAALRIVGAVNDTTERHLMQEQLQLQHRIEAVGRLAGGISHDFNNVLMIIMSYAQLLRDRVPTSDFVCKHVKQILDAAERGASLTQQLLAFSRKQILAPQVVDINAVVEESTKMLKRLLGANIDVIFSPAMELPLAHVDPTQITQILINLCSNASDAMPNGGKILLTTGAVTVDGNFTRPEPVRVTPGEYVLISVTDSGFGMSLEVQSRIFEPFYTTKEMGRGPGLGLSSVYGIVKQSNGYIWVDSRPGEGTTFSVYLPSAVGRTETPVIGSVPTGSRQLNILLVEDEADLRMSLSDVLRSWKHVVLEAEDGADALRIAHRFDGPIDLLVTDIIMPKTSGRELGDRLRKARPEMRIIYMSGYSDQEFDVTKPYSSGSTFLQKPFPFSALLNSISTLFPDKASPK